jgi:CTP-dependent riboflavin kinase
MLDFDAIVSSRSSVGSLGPPGEAEILSLNPQRRVMILHATGWTNLVDGTLNLEVSAEVVPKLLSFKHLIYEEPATVRYPQRYAYIPTLRGGYLYYSATIEHENEVAPALIRRARNALPTRVEAFSNHILRGVLALSDGDRVVCHVSDASA